ncbi:hypothetical protein RirG_101670 [Rhizophagus irregularis DAOM 197198w]|uniref:Uncharacterized protein n=1 Tax=Rhizophagus irregularis (strain DAOM 197198w) TaxID=1432141 RepID=A0A015JH34_RHIIW|nr:hypothetical protein RirG_101670 [Rhizophagus irregularis DAOM 197198w]
MTNVYTLKDINNKGHRLGSAYEQELEKKLYTTLSSKAEINDLCEKLLAKNSEYSEREEDIGNKISQLNASSTKVRSQLISEQKSHSESQRKLEAKYTAEIKLLKSNIKTLKRGATLAQKVSSADKVQILSLKTKIRELEGKLEDIDLERTYHDLDAMGGKPAQISSSEIESLRLELEHAKEDRNSKEYTIECMEKGIESSNNIFKREIDALYSARSKLREENRAFKDQLALKKNTSSQIISSEGIPLESGGAEVVPLSQEIPLASAIPVVASSLMSPMITYSMLALLLIVVIWLVVRKWWNP